MSLWWIEALRDSLDDEEKPRIDVDEDQTLVIVDIPMYEDEQSIKFETIPLGFWLYGMNTLYRSAVRKRLY